MLVKIPNSFVFFVIGNESLRSDLPPWSNSTDVVRQLFWDICSVVKKKQLVFVKRVSGCAGGERHLGHAVQGPVSEVRGESGGGGLSLCA